MIFIMPIYFVISLIIIRLIIKRFPAKHKWLQFLILAFLFYLPVGWDVMLGRAYWQYLCHKDGGLHIYQTVQLGEEHWNDDGYPRFYDEKGNFVEDYFDGKYNYIMLIHDKKFKSNLPVIRSLSQVLDVNTGTVLGEIVTYLYINGWVINTWQPFSTKGSRCPRTSDFQDNALVTNGPKWYKKFTSYIFINKHNKEIE